MPPQRQPRRPPVSGSSFPRSARARVTLATFLGCLVLVSFQQLYFRRHSEAVSSDSGASEQQEEGGSWGLFGSRRPLSIDQAEGGSWPEFDFKECQENPIQPRCSPTDFSVLAEGDLETRLHAVCSAYAIRKATGFSARVLWVKDNTHMPQTRFTDLFQPLDFVKDSGATAGQWMRHMRPTFRTLMLPACLKGEGQPAMYFDAFLSPVNINFVEFDFGKSCALAKQYRGCFNLFHPSSAVEELVRQEPELGRLRKSTAVFVDEVTPGACGGCTGNDSTPDACMMRRLTRHYLRDPSMDFTVGALAAADAVNTAGYFHPLRAPLLLASTKRRAAKCPYSPPLGADDYGSLSRVLQGNPHKLTWRRRSLLEVSEGGEGKGEKGGEKEKDGDEGARLAEQLAKQGVAAKQGAPQGGRRGSPVGFFEIDDSRRAAVAAQAAADDKGGDREPVKLVMPLRVSPGDMAECVRLQAAELFALCEADGFIPMNESSVSSLFIASRGAQRSEVFRSQRSVCASPPIRPITKQKFAMFVIIEEKLKLVYCAIPKVAVTSWLMWLRAQLGLKDPKNPWLALHEYDSGLHQLAIHFTERQAVRLITRPDFFKFTFVRNPFSRAASAYSNKLVKSDTPGKKTGPGSRSYWNWAFFRNVQPLFDAVKDENDLVPFPEFTKLVEAVLERSRWNMDRHIAPQVDICNLNSIKYDYVGKFENLQEDVKKVAGRYGGQHVDVFNFGRNAHYTNASGRLAKVYDQDSYNAVKRIYAQDFYVGLNNITHETPEVLQRLFE